MKFLNDMNLKPINILKISGLVLVVIILITFAFGIISSTFKSLSRSTSNKMAMNESVSFGSSLGLGGGSMSDSIGLSVRNVIPTSEPQMDGGVTIGDNAEEFEVTEYSAMIEARHLDSTCAKISQLKSRDDVIFENASEYERSCNYYFKVKSTNVAEILAVIEALDPKELNESTYTIKRLIDDYTSEVDILENKMKSIEETLSNAISAYDDITKLANRVQDVESLAKIIDSKIKIIERLTQERINVNAQLERINRVKAEQLDRLEYTYFNVNVLEDKFIDGQNLKDSWKMAVKSFVRDINDTAQDITINLISLLFLILQYIIYLFIILIIAKYGWVVVKNIWNK